VIGAVLAGGAGERLRAAAEGGKPAAKLAGRPLVGYPLAALTAVCDRVAVVCKPDTQLPDLDQAERWDEPSRPRHPLAGIVHALERAGEPVLVCGADMPFVTPEACRSLLTVAARGGAVATVAVAGDVLQPLLGVYSPQALGAFRAAAADAPLTRTVERLDPVRVALPAPLVRSVNTAEDLAAAETSVRGA
jgi:molybdopterin-guanine dinucleotide biosynthesis protein A